MMRIRGGGQGTESDLIDGPDEIFNVLFFVEAYSEGGFEGVE